jgi:hypothetical protein
LHEPEYCEKPCSECPCGTVSYWLHEGTLEYHAGGVIGTGTFSKGMNELRWTRTEKIIAKRAFEKCYQKECEALLTRLKEKIASADKPSDLWLIHDFLTEELKKIKDKYDYRYSILILVFARLLKEGWLQEFDLDGIEDDKIEKIKYLAKGIIKAK